MPGANLVVIQAHLALGVLERLLDEVPSRGRPDEVIERCVPRRVRRERPRLVASERLDRKERFLLRLSVAAGLDADRQRDHLDRLLLPVTNREAPPLADVAPAEEVGDPVPRRRPAHLGPCRLAHHHGRGHLQDVALAALGQPVPERRRSSEFRAVRDPRGSRRRSAGAGGGPHPAPARSARPTSAPCRRADRRRTPRAASPGTSNRRPPGTASRTRPISPPAPPRLLPPLRPGPVSCPRPTSRARFTAGRSPSRLRSTSTPTASRDRSRGRTDVGSIARAPEQVGRHVWIPSFATSQLTLVQQSYDTVARPTEKP